MLHNSVKLRQYTSENGWFFFFFSFYVCCKFTGIFEREGVLQKNKNTPLCWKMLFGCLFFFFFLLSKFSLISVTCHHYRKSIFHNPPTLLWPVCPCPCLNDFFFSIPVCGTQSCLRGFCQSSWCLFLFCICITDVLPSVYSCQESNCVKRKQHVSELFGFCMYVNK